MSSRAAYWLDWIERWELSGLSQAAFCRRHRLSYWSFASWKRRLRGPLSRGRPGSREPAGERRSGLRDGVAPAMSGRRGAGSLRRLAFVEVTPPQSVLPREAAPTQSESPLEVAQRSPRYEVVLAGGRVLRLTGGFDAARVRELVEVLESCDASREREQAEVLESC